MDTLLAYERAAPTWGARLGRLGYARAYGAMLAGRCIPSGAVLDVGTGDGLFAEAWVAAGGSADLTLLDPSPAMLRAAAARLGASGIAARRMQGRLEDLAPPPVFAVILAAHVVEHCADMPQAFRALSALLAPGGRVFLVISRPHWCNWLIWLRFRHRWLTENAVRSLGQQAELIHLSTHRFTAGPPSRTSLGYVFTTP